MEAEALRRGSATAPSRGFSDACFVKVELPVELPTSLQSWADDERHHTPHGHLAQLGQRQRGKPQVLGAQGALTTRVN